MNLNAVVQWAIWFTTFSAFHAYSRFTGQQYLIDANLCCNFFHTSSFMQNFANPRWAPITGICFLLPIILHRLESMWLEAGYVYSNSYLFNTVKHLRPLDGLMYFANWNVELLVRYTTLLSQIAASSILSPYYLVNMSFYELQTGLPEVCITAACTTQLNLISFFVDMSATC